MKKIVLAACFVTVTFAQEHATKHRTLKQHFKHHVDRAKKQVDSLLNKFSETAIKLPDLPADQGLLMKPFLDMTHIAQRKNIFNLAFTFDMNPRELTSYYINLRARLDDRQDQAIIKELDEAYRKATSILKTYQNDPAEFNFALQRGTFIIGEIPAKIPVTPFKYGFIKRNNPDKEHIGQTLCFGPLRYQDERGNTVEVANRQALKDCFRANADSSELGCREVSAEIFVEQGDSCADTCWQGYETVPGAQCTIKTS